jgi:hypothetical protein
LIKNQTIASEPAAAAPSRFFGPWLGYYAMLRGRNSFAGTQMCRISLVGFIAVCLVGTCSQGQAAGSFQTKPAFPKVVTAGVSVRIPTISAPDFSARDLVGGCGRGRVRDPQTHTCRGPADIR